MAELIHKVTIGGTDYTSQVTDDVSVTYGHTELFEEFRSPYASFSVVSGTQSFQIDLRADVLIEAQADGVNWYPVFTGFVSDVNYGALGNGHYFADVIATGTLGKLANTVIGGGIFPEEIDGERISKLLLQGLNSTPIGNLTGTIAGNTGTMDNWFNLSVPYEDSFPDVYFTAAEIEPGNCFSLASQYAQQALGYVCENPDGSLVYQPFDYVDVTSDRNYDEAQISTDITFNMNREQLTNQIFWSNEETSGTVSRNSSISTLGVAAQQFQTTVLTAQVDDLLNHWLDYFADVRPRISAVTIPMSACTVNDAEYLLDIYHFKRVSLDLPSSLYNIGETAPTTRFRGIVAGWSWNIAQGETTITLNLIEWRI